MIQTRAYLVSKPLISYQKTISIQEFKTSYKILKYNLYYFLIIIILITASLEKGIFFDMIVYTQLNHNITIYINGDEA
jgi:hypothetical protein